MELALARGKKTYDRRETIKKREADCEIKRAMIQSRSYEVGGLAGKPGTLPMTAEAFP